MFRPLTRILLLLAAAGSLGAATASPSAAPEHLSPVTIRPIRINVGGPAVVSEQGVAWRKDAGFAGGGTVSRPHIQAANAEAPAEVYQTERYGDMTFRQALPAGRYVVKFHFCEAWEGAGGAGGRVFFVEAEDTRLGPIDIVGETKQLHQALVKTVPVTVEDGELTLKFVPTNANLPQINGLEIHPAP